MNGTIYIDNVESLKELDNLDNVKEVIIRKIPIEKDIVEKLASSRVEIVRFNNCIIKDMDELRDLDVKELDLNGSKMDNILFVSTMINLETLILDNTGEVDFTDVSVIKNLKSLSLLNVKVKNEDKLTYLSNLEMLRIDGCNLGDMNMLISLEHLKYLVVDLDQVDKNPDIMRKLMWKGVKVVDYRNQMVVINK